jgi:hypothetical protein
VSQLAVHGSTALLFSGEALGVYIEGITPQSGIIMLYSNLYGNQDYYAAQTITTIFQ